jgi:hypothetical protein
MLIPSSFVGRETTQHLRLGSITSLPLKDQ